MTITVHMPALSPTMEEGTLAKWLVKEGDEVQPGDVIAEIETDKATMEVEAVDGGRIGKILVADGTENVAVNTPIAVILEEGEAADAIDDAAPAPRKPQKKAEKAAPEKTAAEPASRSNKSAETPTRDTRPRSGDDKKEGGRIFASPLAKRLAKQAGLDLSQIDGSGPRGRIVKADIETASKAGPRKTAPQPAAAARPAVDARAFYDAATYDEFPLDNMRKTIARRLTQSMQEIPHFYLTVDCRIDELLKVRKELNTRAGDEVKLSVNDFIVRAAALALKKVPDANVSFAGDALLKHHHADIGIAVAIEGGLITPIVRQADTKGLAQISAEARDLAARARDRKLKPNEFEGGSFSVSNLGMYGVRNFTAVINPPQAAILAVGAGEERPVAVNGKLEVATVMTVTLSCDHRAIDGALGAEFLAAFKSLIEYPAAMLL